MSSKEVRDQIRLAFPATEYSGPITNCDCDECTHLREELGHKSWDQVSAAFLDLTCSPVLLTQEAFAAFLPAYMLRALDDLSRQSVVLEFTVYSLCPGIPEAGDEQAESNSERQLRRLLDRAWLMDRNQIQAIRSFLEFVQQNARAAEWFRPFIAGGLERVWL
jgi:hypothetical protein